MKMSGNVGNTGRRELPRQKYRQPIDDLLDAPKGKRMCPICTQDAMKAWKNKYGSHPKNHKEAMLCKRLYRIKDGKCPKCGHIDITDIDKEVAENIQKGRHSKIKIKPRQQWKGKRKRSNKPETYDDYVYTDGSAGFVYIEV